MPSSPPVAIPMSLLPQRLLFFTFTFTVVVFLPLALSQLPNLCETKANGRYACPYCSASTATSNLGARFEANLLLFKASLERTAVANASFLNATIAAGDGDAANTVYGLATCFADAERPDCAACLAGAAAELQGTRCAGRRGMVLWYAHCLVRYDTAAFFSSADTSPARRFDVPNPNNFSDSARLDAARQRLAARMLPAAATSALRYAFDAEEVTANTTLHGMAQCTEDLPAEECSRCLASHVAWLTSCCADMDGVRLIGPSCYLRYEFMSFVPGTPPSMASLQPPSPTPSVPGNSSRNKTRIYILAGTLGALSLLCFFLLGAFLCCKSRHGSVPPVPWNSGSPTIESLLRQQHPRRYSYSQVKQMTKSFAHKLGQGGNGVVYKGSLPDGREVAVKLLKDAKVDGEEFMNEVASISRTSHVNVVTLLGFCLQGSKRGLVYEYMPNGSLEGYTFGQAPSHGEHSLSWEKLLDIAVGIARGLEYLHRGCNAHIVHFDIKPHNILLDRDLRPRISDFGLAKLYTQKESTIAVSITGARGTIGYIAPEVFSRGVGAVTSKSDVYSYGMMVLEMSGARRSMVDDDTTGSEASSEYFPEYLYQGLYQFCASACGVDGEAAELVRKMVVVGLWCIQISPLCRPSMSLVVEMLEKSTAELQLPPRGS